MLKEKGFESDKYKHETARKASQFRIKIMKEMSCCIGKEWEDKSNDTDNADSLKHGKNGKCIDGDRQSNACGKSVNACGNGKDKEGFKIGNSRVILFIGIEKHFDTQKEKNGKCKNVVEEWEKVIAEFADTPA